MSEDRLIARLAAANPVPGREPSDARAPRRSARRRALLALTAGALLVAPGIAFADQIGALLGIGNGGTPTPASEVSVEDVGELPQMVRKDGFTGQVRYLGRRSGVSFYATKNAAGAPCFAIVARRTTVGCVAGSNPFPSSQQQVLMFPDGSFAGIAADGVAAVAAVNAEGKTLQTVPVKGNLFATGGRVPLPPASETIEALNARGEVIGTGLAKVSNVVLATGIGPLIDALAHFREQVAICKQKGASSYTAVRQCTAEAEATTATEP